MAGIKFSATIAEQALAAATAETLIQIVAASNHRVLLKRFGVFFDGVSVTGEPVQIVLLRQTTAGTSSSLTLVKLSPGDDETLQTTALQGFSSTEPTAGDILEVYECHPQQGIYIIYPLGDEIIIPGGTRLALQVTAPAIVNARAFMICEE